MSKQERVKKIREWFQVELVKYNIAAFMYKIEFDEREGGGWITATNGNGKQIVCGVMVDTKGNVIDKTMLTMKEVPQMDQVDVVEMSEQYGRYM